MFVAHASIDLVMTAVSCRLRRARTAQASADRAPEIKGSTVGNNEQAAREGGFDRGPPFRAEAFTSAD